MTVVHTKIGHIRYYIQNYFHYHKDSALLLSANSFCLEIRVLHFPVLSLKKNSGLLLALLFTYSVSRWMQGKENKGRMIPGQKFRAWIWVVTLLNFNCLGWEFQIPSFTCSVGHTCVLQAVMHLGLVVMGKAAQLTARARGSGCHSETRASRLQWWMRQAVSSIPSTKTLSLSPSSFLTWFLKSNGAVWFLWMQSLKTLSEAVNACTNDPLADLFQKDPYEFYQFLRMFKA